ncbi:MAG: HD domain-containing protein [Candidatus Omnitrophica bacterium]|nr:HD domain-containing protein [Candidatus Omnitrophota bacterium]
MNISDLEEIKESQLPLTKNMNLYFDSGNNQFVLYKPAGKLISDIRLDSKRVPILYIDVKDKKKMAILAQRYYNRVLEKSIKNGNLNQVRNILVQIVEDVMTEPRSGALDVMPETMDILIKNYVDQPQNLRALAQLSFKDYTTSIHSINVMAYSIVYCIHAGYSLEDTLNIGLGSLFHDIGKTQISSRILRAPRKLSPEEFEIMKSHTTKGYDLILDSNLDKKMIQAAVLHHHEKLDGSGYPNNIFDVSECGQILGVIDCYEALTNESRPYRNSMKPIEALTVIKSDVEKEKLNKKIFEKFAYSLV